MDFYIQYQNEILIWVFLILLIFWKKIQNFIRKISWKWDYNKLTQIDFKHAELYKLISGLGFSILQNNLAESLSELENFYYKNSKNFSKNIQNEYAKIFYNFSTFDSWNRNNSKMIEICEQNWIIIKKLEEIILNETNYTEFLFNKETKPKFNNTNI